MATTIEKRTTVVLTRTFANKDGDAAGVGTSGVAFNPTTVTAYLYRGGTLVATLVAGTDAAWVENHVTTGKYVLVYTCADAGTWRARVEGAWTRTDAQAGYSAEEVTWSVN